MSLVAPPTGPQHDLRSGGSVIYPCELDRVTPVHSFRFSEDDLPVLRS
jgi:hypothetical protein